MHYNKWRDLRWSVLATCWYPWNFGFTWHKQKTILIKRVHLILAHETLLAVYYSTFLQALVDNSLPCEFNGTIPENNLHSIQIKNTTIISCTLSLRKNTLCFSTCLVKVHTTATFLPSSRLSSLSLEMLEISSAYWYCVMMETFLTTVTICIIAKQNTMIILKCQNKLANITEYLTNSNIASTSSINLEPLLLTQAQGRTRTWNNSYILIKFPIKYFEGRILPLFNKWCYDSCIIEITNHW